MIFSLLVLALAPVGALFLFFYLRDRYREPLPPLLATFALGAGSLLPTVATSLALQRLTGLSSRASGLGELFLTALIIVGVVEEGYKFLVVRLYSYNLKEFDEPYDGIMYSATAALGFASLENVLYVLSGSHGTAIGRALLAVPSHAFFGVLMGFFLGEAKFAATTSRSILLSLLGLTLAILAHTVYDFMVFALAKRPLMFLVIPVFVVLSWVILFSATKRQANQSPQRQPALAALKNVYITPEVTEEEKTPPPDSQSGLPPSTLP